MRLLERARSELAVLRSLARGLPAGLGRAEQLDAFYDAQGPHYDAFRERLLHGRRDLIDGVIVPEHAEVVELGGGTGRVLEYFGERIETLRRYRVVDLCRPLLRQAAVRSRRLPQLQAIHADACQWRPEQLVDAVILSYALTMIPDWQSCIDNAIAMLKPGGTLAVVDFHIGPEHGGLSRRLWPAWFGHDGVELDPRRLAALCRALPEHRLVKGQAPVPYLPLLRVPYYCYWGRKP